MPVLAQKHSFLKDMKGGEANGTNNWTMEEPNEEWKAFPIGKLSWTENSNPSQYGKEG